jgi:hypothetical protein
MACTCAWGRTSPATNDASLILANWKNDEHKTSW